MPAELAQTNAEPGRIRVAPSAAVELSFSLFAMQKKCDPSPARQDSNLPWNLAVEAVSGLCERVASFWGDLVGGWGEVILIAHWGGTLFDGTLDRFFAEFDSVILRSGPVPLMPTETDEEQHAIEERIQRMRESPQLRADYCQLLKEVWSALAPMWDGGAHAEATQLAPVISERLEREQDWRQVVVCRMARRVPFVEMIEHAIARGELVVVPMLLSRDGQLIFSLPGVFVVAFGPESQNKYVARREHAQRAATALKILSDPTRNTILMSLLHSPDTITDIAEFLEVSQPTVSVHVKMLREAGLLEAERRGNQTVYTGRPEAVRSFAPFRGE